MAAKFKAPRGTHDVCPPDVTRWQYLEQRFSEIASLYGYQEIRTPAFEATDLFVRSSGDTSEVVTKQMYTFTDKGDRSMTLKPEGTAPAIRAYIENGLGQQGQTTRLWYATPIFRYERPQKGRYRQSHQVGLELIGSPSPAADAEIMEMTYRFYEALGITGIKVFLNCIGREETRSKFSAAILDHVSGWLADQDLEGQEKARKNPLRLLDSKDEAINAAIDGAPSILDFLEDTSRENFETIQASLSAAGVEFEVMPKIVRGLDYYTDTVFEVHSLGLGSQNALCGGGRYDTLIQDVGGPDMPSVGVAMGVERALIVMEEQGVGIDPQKTDVFVVSAGAECEQAAQQLARDLRKAGITVLIDIDAKNLKNQMKQAGRSGARFSAIIGEEELSSGVVALRDMEKGEQRAVPPSELADVIRKG